jgi:hypothetical protein
MDVEVDLAPGGGLCRPPWLNMTWLSPKERSEAQAVAAVVVGVLHDEANALLPLDGRAHVRNMDHGNDSSLHRPQRIAAVTRVLARS